MKWSTRDVVVAIIATLLLVTEVCVAYVLYSRGAETIQDPWLLDSVFEGTDLMQTTTILLKQRNLDVLLELAYNVSNPSSPSYGEHATAEEIARLVQPEQSDRDLVTSWLQGSNLEEHVHYSWYADAVKVHSASVAHIEDLLNATFFRATHAEADDNLFVAIGDVSIPDNLVGVVEMITGVTDFLSRTVRLSRAKFDISQATSHRDRDVAYAETRAEYEEVINSAIFPRELRQLYQQSYDIKCTSPASRIAVAEFGQGSVNDELLQQYMALTNETLMKMPTAVGSTISWDTCNGVGSTTEVLLDVESLLSMAPNCSIEIVNSPGSFLEYFMDAANDSSTPTVHTMSYGSYASSLCIDDCGNSTAVSHIRYMQRADIELQKLAARGVSIFVSSGDDGVCANSYSSSVVEHADWPAAQPLYPAMSEFVTSVGGTGLTDGGRFSACDMDTCKFATGSGFSSYAPVPPYQQAFVERYLQEMDAELPDAVNFNFSNRAYPDVSSLGHGTLLLLINSFECECNMNGSSIISNYSVLAAHGGGTSLASPLVAAMVVLLNDQLIQSGRSPLGFLNPLLYSIANSTNPGYLDVHRRPSNHPVFMDIVRGDRNRTPRSSSNACAEFRTCSSCLSVPTTNEYSCGWCAITGTCMIYNTSEPDISLTDPGCPAIDDASWVVEPAQCSTCSELFNCTACASEAGCSWCAKEGMCVETDIYNASCPVRATDAGECDPCWTFLHQKSCDACLSAGCGQCYLPPTVTQHPVAFCLSGVNSGPTNDFTLGELTVAGSVCTFEGDSVTATNMEWQFGECQEDYYCRPEVGSAQISCGTPENGFLPSKGWDSLSGLGQINFYHLSRYLEVRAVPVPDGDDELALLTICGILAGIAVTVGIGVGVFMKTVAR